MVGRSAVVCLSLIAASALLLLFASTNPATAGTYKSGYTTILSCNGADGVYGTVDDSCVNGAYNANTASLTADMLSDFSITGMCGNAIDDDADTVVNDGCWTRGSYADCDANQDGDCADAGEAALCTNAINDDPLDDSYINDGCPKVGASEKNHSNFQRLVTLGIPDTWTVATDKQIPDGAYVGKLVADSTLALFGGKCTSPTQVTIPMFDCTTDNFEGVNDGCPASGAAETGNWCNDSLDNDGDTLVNDGCPAIPGPGTTGREGTAGSPACTDAIDNDGDGDPIVDWAGDGSNLTNAGTQAGNLPTGCTKYPKFINDQTEGMTPRARYYGFTTVVGDPTQLEFLIFSPGQLTSIGKLPETDIIDPLGYANYVVLDNPDAPNLPGNPLDEFCTPLRTTTDLFGKTAGDGTVQTSPSINWREPGYSVTYPGDKCDSPAVDNDGDTTANEFCGYQRVKNPAAGTGIWGTGTHLAGAYGQSNRDADGDTIVNNEDECPFNVDNEVDANNNNIDSVCDPLEGAPGSCPTAADCDGDNYSNQADNCPFVAQANQADADQDGIGDACDPNPNTATTEGHMLNDMPMGAICIGAADTDGDGWCDATENISPGGGVLSNAADANSVPEYIALDYAIRAGDPLGSADPPGIENPPGYAPRTCTDYVYYDVNQNNPADPHANGAPASGWVDNDGDTQFNATGTPPDANCTLSMTGDNDQDGKAEATDNCGSRVNDGCPTVGTAAESGANCTNATNDDGDGVNDGCPKAATNDDSPDDTVINDGCPVVGSRLDCDTDATPDGDCTDPGEPALCANAVDDDGDTTVDDGCPQVGSVAESGSQCIDPESGANCDNATDDDGDTLVNDGCPQVGTAAESGAQCTNATNDDGDGVNDGCPTFAGTGESGANCDNAIDDDIANDSVWNPSQLDTDGDGQGDACDVDDDADGINDVDEWRFGGAGVGLRSSDPKNVCDPRNFDLKADNKINVLDVTTFIAALKVSDRPCFPPINTNVCP